MNGNLPTNTYTYFNELDYGHNSSGDTTDATFDSTLYLKKNGDAMNGELKINNHIRFNDGTIQTTALDVDTIELINDIIDSVTYIDISGDTTQIPKIKCDSIEFPSGLQTIPFNTTLKNQINTNVGKLQGITNIGNDIVTEGKTVNIKDSPKIDVVNTLGSHTKFDGAISILRSASVYRKWWIGSIGDDVNPQNSFNICVNGNHPEPESVLQLEPNGTLKVKQLDINGEIMSDYLQDVTDLKADVSTNTAEIDSHSLDIATLQTDQLATTYTLVDPLYGL